MATATSNAVSLSGNSLIDGLIQGGKWTGSTTLSYSFWNTSGGSWTNTQKDYARDIFDSIENITGLNFSEVSPTSGTHLNNSSDLSLYFKTWDSTTEGLSFFPDPSIVTATLTSLGYSRVSYPTADGDVTINANSSGWTQGASEGGDGYWTLLHEIGHAIGLKHPFDDGGNSNPTFTELGISALDENAFTVMSYTQHFSSLTSGQPVTFMPLDVAALQYIYGTNTTYHSGDNTYTLTSTGKLQTIWDTGGTDTFDASSMTTAVSMDIASGGFSNYGTRTITAVAIGATIENGTGGSAGDTISANDSNNTLIGNNGSDILYGYGGTDTIYGGAGLVSPSDSADTVYGGSGTDYLYGNGGADIIFGGTGATDTTDTSDVIYGGADNDTMYGNAGEDALFGSSGGDLMYGGGGSDTIYGGNGISDPNDTADTMYGNDGHDTMFGNGGADVLLGGDGYDVFFGGAGDDTFYGSTGVDRYFEYSSSGNDYIADFESTDSIWIQSGINSSSITSASIALANASTSGSNVLVSLGGSASITLLNYSLASLTTDNFVVF